MSKTELHVLMFPFFAFGHISPFVQLSNKLSLHGVRITFLSPPGNIDRIKSSLHLTPSAQIIPLPLPPLDGLPPGTENTSQITRAIAELLATAVDLLQPQIKTLLSQIKPDFVMFDFFQYWIPKLCSDLGIKTLCFSVFSAISGAYLTVPARSGEISTPNVENLTKPPKGFPLTSITCAKKFQAQDFSYVFKCFDGPSVFSRVLEGLNGCTFMVIKTCNEMEGPYVDFMEKQFEKPALLTGPLVPEPPSGVLEEKWGTWLAKFPSRSVVFCSFGSETYLTDDQIKELTLGLELTGLPFILVLNFPSGVDNDETKLAQSLPKGFAERVKDRGIVHTGWVQQQLILAHQSVGCYLFHSGFSSVIEAFVNDCQLVLLPFKGDQFLNSKLIAEDMKAGVEVNWRDEDGYFGKDDICEALKAMMVEVDKEPSLSIRASHKKWRDFLLDREIQSKFLADLVQKLKDHCFRVLN